MSLRALVIGLALAATGFAIALVNLLIWRSTPLLALASLLAGISIYISARWYVERRRRERERKAEAVETINQLRERYGHRPQR